MPFLPLNPEAQRTQEGKCAELELVCQQVGPQAPQILWPSWAGKVPGWPPKKRGQHLQGLTLQAAFLCSSLIPISLPLTCHSPINVKIRVTAGLCIQLSQHLFCQAALFSNCPNPTSLSGTSFTLLPVCPVPGGMRPQERQRPSTSNKVDYLYRIWVC